MAPDLIPLSPEQGYVAVISDWTDGRVLVAPFAPFMPPATVGDLSTGREFLSLRVIAKAFRRWWRQVVLGHD